MLYDVQYDDDDDDDNIMTYNSVCTTHYFCYQLNGCLLNVAFLDIIV